MTLQSEHGAIYANELLSQLGVKNRVSILQDHPALSWRRSGLQNVTKLMLPLPLIAHTDGLLQVLKNFNPNSSLPHSAGLLIGERARLTKHERQGRYSASGQGLLLDAKDGRFALNMPRQDDWDLMPAWLEEAVSDWNGIQDAVKNHSTDRLVTRGIEMGLAIAKDMIPSKNDSWYHIKQFMPSQIHDRPLIVDLSSLWAGPLTSSLLSIMNTECIKVESPSRPDGMRLGNEDFYSLINAGKNCVALDFNEEADLIKLRNLLERADIVIEASRPRVFPQLGIIAEEYVERKPGKIWARLTAYGQSSNRIGFGDDIGIAAGLSTVMEQVYGEPCFVGDAIADPVSAIHLAFLIRIMMEKGGGTVIDVSMQDTLRYAMGEISQSVATIATEWEKISANDNMPLYPMRQLNGVVKILGQDTDRLC